MPQDHSIFADRVAARIHWAATCDRFIDAHFFTASAKRCSNRGGDLSFAHAGVGASDKKSAGHCEDLAAML
jgi:hypothetical protein